MANRYAVASTNWNLTSTWDNGATLGLPTSADDVYANGFTPVINQSITVQSLRNGAATGINAGGGYSVTTGGLTINANIISSSTTAITALHPATTLLAINGDSTALTTAPGIVLAGGGNLNYTGTLTGGTSVSSGGAGLLITSGSNGSVVNINGACNGNSGNANGGPGLDISGSVANVVVNLTGNHAASLAPAIVVRSSGANTLNITGSITAGTAEGLRVTSATATINHVGAAYASASSPAITTTSVNAILNLTGPLVSSDGTGGNASGAGVNPIYCYRWFPADTALATFSMTMRGATVSGSPLSRPARTLYLTDAYAASYPATSNVRSGTTYGAGNSLLGTCAVPPAGSVALGVPVDNTTGTAAITGSSIRSALGMASANLDTQLAAIPTTAAPSASTIATAVWAASSRTLTQTIASASDVAAAVWSAVTRTITGGVVDTLTNAPTVPTPSEIASQVRVELATELARLDAAISSRLATSGYTTPPTAAAIATAVNTALDRSGFSLTEAERQAISVAVQAGILNENDGQAILNAIVGAIGNQNIDQVALVAAIRADLERSGGTLASRSTLTASQVRTELAPELGNLDTTVSSRLPSSGYTAPPSAASIATAVWSAGTRSLTQTIASAADVAAAVWSAVVRTLTSNPAPSAADNAAAVRQELAPELERVANCATTHEVGDIVQGSLDPEN